MRPNAATRALLGDKWLNNHSAPLCLLLLRDTPRAAASVKAFYFGNSTWHRELIPSVPSARSHRWFPCVLALTAQRRREPKQRFISASLLPQTQRELLIKAAFRAVFRLILEASLCARGEVGEVLSVSWGAFCRGALRDLAGGDDDDACSSITQHSSW